MSPDRSLNKVAYYYPERTLALIGAGVAILGLVLAFPLSRALDRQSTEGVNFGAAFAEVLGPIIAVLGTLAILMAGVLRVIENRGAMRKGGSGPMHR